MQTSTPQSPAKKVYKGLLAAFTWFAIGLQWYLTTESIINFFSYFTILCNTSIALCLTISLLYPSSVLGRFFSKESVRSAIALYIFIVGLVYNLELRGLVAMEGWQLFVDTVLHVVIPVFYIIYCLVFVPKGALQGIDGLSWGFFPLIYLIYSLIRGAVVNWYPYPFLNAAKLGYEKIFLNIAMMIAVFFVAGLIFIAVNRSLKKMKNEIYPVNRNAFRVACMC